MRYGYIRTIYEAVTGMRRMQLLLDTETQAAVERQMERYGIGNLTDLMRFAVQLLDASPMLTYPIPEPQARGWSASKSSSSQQ